MANMRFDIEFTNEADRLRIASAIVGAIGDLLETDRVEGLLFATDDDTEWVRGGYKEEQDG